MAFVFKEERKFKTI